MNKKLVTLLLASVFLFSVCSAAVASEPQYAEPKVIDTTVEAFSGYDSYVHNPDIPLHIRANYSNLRESAGSWSMIYRVSNGQAGIISEDYNAAPWSIAEHVRNLTYDSPDYWEPISINGIPWQIFTSPGIYDDRDGMEGVPGRVTVADNITYLMTNPEDTYSATRPELPTGDKKMVSIYENQNIAVLYTSTTATPKALLARPCTQNGRMLVPLRGIVDYLGADVGWDSKTSSILIKNSAKEIKLQAGSNTANINGASVQMDTAPTLVNGYTMVPLRFLSEQLGYNVKWIGDINKNVHRADISN